MSIETLNDKNSTREMLNDFFSKEMKEVVDSVPEMSENEIKQLNKSQLYEIFSQSEWKSYKDQNWDYYILINYKNQKRKLYYTLGKNLKNGHTYISIDSVDNYHISIWRKDWSKIVWIYAEIGNSNIAENIYRWELTYKNGDFRPKK